MVASGTASGADQRTGRRTSDRAVLDAVLDTHTHRPHTHTRSSIEAAACATGSRGCPPTVPELPGPLDFPDAPSEPAAPHRDHRTADVARAFHLSKLGADDDIRALSAFRSAVASFVKHVSETRRPMVVAQRIRDAAVLIDVQAFEAMQERLELLDDIYRAEARLAAGDGASTASGSSPHSIASSRSRFAAVTFRAAQ